MIALDSVKDDIFLLFLHKRFNRRTSITHINNRILEYQDIFTEMKLGFYRRRRKKEVLLDELAEKPSEA
jgi:hypothetical protein